MTTTRLTIHDLADLPEDNATRYELIEGELHVTTAPHLDHQRVVGAIFLALHVWSRQTKAGTTIIAPGVIFADDEAMIPDLVWVSGARTAEVIGVDGKLHTAPDLVVEVLSPGAQNESRDRKLKHARYAFWGVPEYWITDRFTRTVEVYRLTGRAYTHVTTLGEADQIDSPLLPGFVCPISEFFADLR
jgi:Uma2 family endonuclease